MYYGTERGMNWTYDVPTTGKRDFKRYHLSQQIVNNSCMIHTLREDAYVYVIKKMISSV